MPQASELSTFEQLNAAIEAQGGVVPLSKLKGSASYMQTAALSETTDAKLKEGLIQHAKDNGMNISSDQANKMLQKLKEGGDYLTKSIKDAFNSVAKLEGTQQGAKTRSDFAKVDQANSDYPGGFKQFSADQARLQTQGAVGDVQGVKELMSHPEKIKKFFDEGLKKMSADRREEYKEGLIKSGLFDEKGNVHPENYAKASAFFNANNLVGRNSFSYAGVTLSGSFGETPTVNVDEQSSLKDGESYTQGNMEPIKAILAKSGIKPSDPDYKRTAIAMEKLAQTKNQTERNAAVYSYAAVIAHGSKEDRKELTDKILNGGPEGMFDGVKDWAKDHAGWLTGAGGLIFGGQEAWSRATKTELVRDTKGKIIGEAPKGGWITKGVETTATATRRFWSGSRVAAKYLMQGAKVVKNMGTPGKIAATVLGVTAGAIVARADDTHSFESDFDTGDNKSYNTDNQKRDNNKKEQVKQQTKHKNSLNNIPNYNTQNKGGQEAENSQNTDDVANTKSAKLGKTEPKNKNNITNNNFLNTVGEMFLGEKGLQNTKDIYNKGEGINGLLASGFTGAGAFLDETINGAKNLGFSIGAEIDSLTSNRSYNESKYLMEAVMGRWDVGNMNTSGVMHNNFGAFFDEQNRLSAHNTLPVNNGFAGIRATNTVPTIQGAVQTVAAAQADPGLPQAIDTYNTQQNIQTIQGGLGNSFAMQTRGGAMRFAQGSNGGTNITMPGALSSTAIFYLVHFLFLSLYHL